MYEKLVKRLINLRICIQQSGSIEDYPLLREAADAIEELENVLDNLNKTKSRWIPVTERLPESGTRALVMRFDFVTETPFYDLLWFDKGEWWNRHYTGDYAYAVTHWMPLPEPPKEGEGG